MPKSQTVWSNATKNPDAWVATARTATAWGNEANFPASYHYSDATLTYNNVARPYNYISAFPTDQLNSRNKTSWSAANKNVSTWSNEAPQLVGYTYDSSATFDSGFAYDYSMASANQSNNKNATTWVVTV